MAGLLGWVMLTGRYCIVTGLGLTKDKIRRPDSGGLTSLLKGLAVPRLWPSWKLSIQHHGNKSSIAMGTRLITLSQSLVSQFSCLVSFLEKWNEHFESVAFRRLYVGICELFQQTKCDLQFTISSPKSRGRGRGRGRGRVRVRVWAIVNLDSSPSPRHQKCDLSWTRVPVMSHESWVIQVWLLVQAWYLTFEEKK